VWIQQKRLKHLVLPEALQFERIQFTKITEEFQTPSHGGTVLISLACHPGVFLAGILILPAA
jgi:hypothetical protein